jgi:hypothetical protein
MKVQCLDFDQEGDFQEELWDWHAASLVGHHRETGCHLDPSAFEKMVNHCRVVLEDEPGLSLSKANSVDYLGWASEL